MALPRLLYLVHRIPYPPNKGDKVRSYHLLLFLRRHFDIYLAAFVDDRNDWQYIEKLQPLCKDSAFFAISPWRRRLRSLAGLLVGKQALSLLYYRHAAMQNWVNHCLAAKQITSCLVFSSVMGQFVATHMPRLETVLDFVDMDSEKWRQYAQAKRWPASWVYRLEAERLFLFERLMAQQCKNSVFVSAQEADLFIARCPQLAGKVSSIQNGVDTDYFNPDLALINPYQQNKPVLVFTGAMDYWANVDAVMWFVQHIWPGIHRRNPAAQCYIVGSRPDKAVRALAHADDIVVTGGVADIRPYLKFAHAAIAPLRIARGIQNKVLEAFAMEKPVLATAAAMEGIVNPPAACYAVADQDRTWEAQALQALAAKTAPRLQASRQFILQNYTWEANLQAFSRLLTAEQKMQ